MTEAGDDCVCSDRMVSPALEDHRLPDTNCLVQVKVTSVVILFGGCSPFVWCFTLNRLYARGIGYHVPSCCLQEVYVVCQSRLFQEHMQALCFLLFLLLH